VELTTFLILVAAGLAAGIINAVVGSGTLIVYPVLIALGVPPVLANGTNTTGLCLGSLASAVGYRRELKGRMRRLAAPLVGTVVAATFGAWLVIALPAHVFASVVPWLILMAAVMVAIQPRVGRWLKSRRGDKPHSLVTLTAGTSTVGIYGGYFGAAQGVFYMAVLGVLYDSNIQRSNGAKNLLASAANLTAAVVFALSGRVLWLAALAVAIGAIAGGFTGAHIGRRLPDKAMRIALVTIAVISAVVLLVKR